MERFLEHLNPEQRAAVIATGNVLITACPGSGKTRVLTHKLALELQSIKSKKKLIALTYTNRAADEIKKRIGQFDIETEQLWAGTIHSFCLEWILRPYLGDCEELYNGFSLIDEYDSDQLFSDLREKHGIGAFDHVKRSFNLNGTFNTIIDAHIPLIEDYKATLRERGLIDFDDILYYSYKLLIDFPIISLRLSNIFPQIFVDEYQDTQELQYAILAEIVKAANNRTKMFFVGDISQAIYGSIGGVAKPAIQISQQFGNIEIQELNLAGNYRSNQRIINYYSNYQLTNFRIVSMAARANEAGTITYNRAVTKDNVHEHIAATILSYIDQGIPTNEICILAPQWRMIIPMGRKLKTALPHVDFDAFGLSPFRRVRENVWYKLIKLFISQPENSNYIMRYQWANDLLVDLDHYIPHFIAHVENRKRYILRLIRSFNSEIRNSYDYMEAAIEFFLSSLTIDIDQYPELSDRLTSFLTQTKAELDRADFDYATDIETLKRVYNTNNGVVISTCHGVKGEEYEVVIAFGLLHGFIPNWGEVDAQASKKLLYVICSRAKMHLHLISETGHQTRSRRPYTATAELDRVAFQYDN